MAYADTLTEQERARGRRYAYGSAIAGCVSEVMLDSSAIIILYFTMLKASPMVTMFSSSLTGILQLLLLIPSTLIIGKIGMQASVKYACITGCVGYLMIAAAAFFPSIFAVPLALAGVFVYSSQRSIYGASWYPLLDNFLRPCDRAKFFAVLRTSYMLFNCAFFFLIGLLLGKEPPFWLMQIVIGMAGVILLLRWYCIAHFPMEKDRADGSYDLRKALGISIRNGPLTSYSVYICFLAMSYTVLLPLLFLYLRKGVQMEPGTIQILSSVGMAGSVTGHSVYGLLSRKFRLKWLELMVHFCVICLALTLFLLDQNMPGFTCWIGFLVFFVSVNNAWMMCNNSMEYLALARPGNKTMATAFCQTYSSIGTAIGRTGSSLLLGSSILAANWQIGTRSFCIYQSIFLLVAVLAVFALVMLPILPSFVPQHEDYYNSADRK